MDEAELTIESAEAIYERARTTEKQLWSKVIKEAYDARENCVMAALVEVHVDIPRYYPAKMATFISQFKLEGTDMAEILTKWLARRSRARYVDFNEAGKLRVPLDEFGEAEASEALRDCKKVLAFVRELVEM